MRRMRLLLLTAGLFLMVVSAAHAAPAGMLKQFKVPTPRSDPGAITNGSDGNRWFAERNLNSATGVGLPNIGRITPAGAITEFFLPALDGASLSDIVQGPGNILFFNSNDPTLGRITTNGQYLPLIDMPDGGMRGGEMAIDSVRNRLWITDFNNDSIWRYDIPADPTAVGTFTQFRIAPPTQSTDPTDVAVGADGTVWFGFQGLNADATAVENGIGRLDPATGAITRTVTNLAPRAITVANDGDIWFTARFVPQGVGEVDGATGALVREITLASNPGPSGIAAAPDGSVWFAQETAGNVARIDDAGVITEGKAVKGSGPFGVTVDSLGNPWYTMLAANKIAQLQLR
jgi:streptogramin lyase